MSFWLKYLSSGTFPMIISEIYNTDTTPLLILKTYLSSNENLVFVCSGSSSTTVSLLADCNFG